MLTCILEAAAYLYHAARMVDSRLPAWDMMQRFVETRNEKDTFRAGLENCPNPMSMLIKFQGVLDASRHGACLDDHGIPVTRKGVEVFAPIINMRTSFFVRFAMDHYVSIPPAFPQAVPG